MKPSVAALGDVTRILLRQVPTAATSGDLSRALLQVDVKGLSNVELYYKHFRPTGKAILTFSLPDYAHDAVRRLKEVGVLGAKVNPEPIEDRNKLLAKPAGWQVTVDGNGPSASVSPGRTVTLYGLPGKITISAIQTLVKGFKLAKPKGHPPIQLVALPERKFSMVSRACIHLESEAEAQRLVRKLHMTPFKNVEGAPVVKAEIIY